MIQELFAVEAVQGVELSDDLLGVSLIDETTETSAVSTDEGELRAYLQSQIIKRKITHAVVHCTATQPTTSVSSIVNYWKNNLGWKSPGYHIIIKPEGFTVLLNFNGVSNGAIGYNGTGVHFSYVGGIDKQGKPKDTRNEWQKKAIAICLEEMKVKFPNLKVIGHNEVANKACPSFKVKDEYPDFWTGK